MAALEFLLREAKDFLSSELSLSQGKSEIKIYSNEDWLKFCSANNFDAKNEGLFIPESLTAYVNGSSSFLISNILHEFFGHGVFCEQSSIGKHIVSIARDPNKSMDYLYSEIDPGVQLLGICSSNIGNYEGFAMWLEYVLCDGTGNKKLWGEKKDVMPLDLKRLFEHFAEAEGRLGRFGFMAQMGFPKEYDANILACVLRNIYKESFRNIEFAVLYGSRKPESDIDLFIVSDNPSFNSHNGWLDIYELNREDFEKRVRLLDISVTDPLFTGEIICGNKTFLEETRQNILSQEISKEAVYYNFKQAEFQKNALQNLKGDTILEKASLSYLKSYTANAKALGQGKKFLTFKSLKEKGLID
ncbi:MAG: nucleotidyltransferase domain-containing protein [Candidatus Woesearchaeota archaeon]